MNISDNELLYMIRSRDFFARKLLFEKYKLLIEKFVFDVYKDCKNVDVNDIRQELNICVLKSIEDYTEGKGAFFSYLYACINHKVSNIKRDFYQSSNSFLNLSISLEEISQGIDRKYGDLLEDDCKFTNPIYMYSVQEAKEKLANGLSFLSELERKVVELYNLRTPRNKICELLNINLK